jgi:hypothetical protein
VVDSDDVLEVFLGTLLALIVFRFAVLPAMGRRRRRYRF